MSGHNKRYGAPTEKWGIPTKEQFWAPKSKPGPHKHDESVPLVVLLRDILEYAESSREANLVIDDKKVLVDGRVATEKNRPVGLMDVISFPDLDEHYRVLFDQHGKIRLGPVEEGAENWKLAKIKEKTSVDGDRTQLNLHDGRNILVDSSEAPDTKDVLKLDLPSQNIMESIEFEEGQMALITGGKHIGEIGVIEEYEIVKGPQSNIVHFEGGISTIEGYTFVIGRDTPEIKIPEVGII